MEGAALMPLSGRESVRHLIVHLGRIPDESRRELRDVLGREGRAIKVDAGRRAAWSSRIPAAISVRTRLTGKRPGVIVSVSAKRAPHARPYEGAAGGGTFRHPVFGNRGQWVTEPVRPFLLPAGRARLPQTTRAIAEAVRHVIRRHIG